MTSSIRGLTNLGNTCFFNSSLQALYAALEGATQWNEIPSAKIYTPFLDTMKLLNNSGKKIGNPGQLLTALTTKTHQFNNRRQHDSHELIIHLISSILEEFDRKEITDHPIQNLFTGTLAGIVQCQNCHYRSCSSNKFVDISLEIPGSRHLFKYPSKQVVVTRVLRSDKKRGEKKSTVNPDEEKVSSHNSQVENNTIGEGPVTAQQTLSQTDSISENPVRDLEPISLQVPQTDDSLDDEEKFDIVEPVDIAPVKGPSDLLSLFDCLKEYTSKEYLTEESGNGYNCPKCSNPASSSSPIKRSADKRLLLLSFPNLLLIHFKRLLPGGKCSFQISFPVELNLTPFQGLKTPSADQIHSPNYTLKAVIVHHGAGNGGHYVAYAHRDGQWYHTSDAATRLATVREVLESQAYILMYRKIDEQNDPELVERFGTLRVQDETTNDPNVNDGETENGDELEEDNNYS